MVSTKIFSSTITVYYCFHCIFDPKVAALVSIRDFFQKTLNYLKLLNGSVIISKYV